MSRNHSPSSSSRTFALAAAVALLSPLSVWASATGPIYSFDFTDSFYRANGIEPTRVLDRMNGNDGISIVAHTTQSNRRDVRALLTVTTYDHSGQLYFFHPFAFLMPDSFTTNAAGQAARQLAESANLYAFPRATNPQGEAFPKRQDDLSDLRDGYFSNNPMGLWKINFVRYTAAATGTAAGQAALAQLAAVNGKDLDGTPVIRTLGELENLKASGYVTVRAAPVDGSEGPPWFSCPIMKDPRNGAIAPDSFLDVPRDANGVPPASSQEFLRQFQCLKNTGDYCN